jgi:hypothetical protein
MSIPEDSMIFPDIFEGHVMGFFTTKHMGSHIEDITGRKIYFPIQEHTDIVMELDPSLTPKVADAVITDRFDVLIGIKVADCVPVLVFDTRNLVIGAVHAGWRGTAKGILRKTINQLEYRYRSRPEDLLISIGPSIKECCYEVNSDVFESVIKESGPGEYYSKNGDKYRIDLQEANKLQAVSVGVPIEQITSINECTHCAEDKYHSYRRDKSKNRQGAFIGLP